MADISILFLASTWKYDGHGITSINRSIINDLWMADQNATKVKMTCALLEQEDHLITLEEREDAKKHKVNLIGAMLPRGVEDLPEVTEVDRYCYAFFQHIDFKTLKVTHIVGHMPNMVNAAFSLRDIFRIAGQSPKVVLVIHTLPTKNSTTDMASLSNVLLESDIVVSVGHPMYQEISQYIRTLPDENKKPRHKVYIPGGPVELLSTKRPSKHEHKQGPRNILVITGERSKGTAAKGLDYEVAVAASTKAAGIIANETSDTFQNRKMQLLTVGSLAEERDEWENQFADVRAMVQSERKLLNFEYQCFNNVLDLKKFFQLASVCILPFRSYSSVYCVEGV